MQFDSLGRHPRLLSRLAKGRRPVRRGGRAPPAKSDQTAGKPRPPRGALAIWLRGGGASAAANVAIAVFAESRVAARRLRLSGRGHFANGGDSRAGAAINQIAKTLDAELHVVPMRLDRPTRDFTRRAGDGRERAPCRDRDRLSHGTEAVRPARGRQMVVPTRPQPPRCVRRCSAAARRAGPGAAPASTRPD